MSSLISTLVLMTNIACVPSPITNEEAKLLAIHASYASGVSARFVLDAYSEMDQYDPTGIEFRVFATNPDPGTSSNLAGWFTVDTITAALSDPILDGKPIEVPAVQDEQRQLRITHCQQPN